MIRSGEAPAIGWSRNMLHSGFRTLHRSVIRRQTPFAARISGTLFRSETLSQDAMPLTQMQIIQSLGDAMSWFERELAWGVPTAELRHLNGRIGELYAALITGGQMATSVNQHGYDVVTGAGDHVSVKTTSMMTGSGHVSFNPKTLDSVDRVIILRINTDEMQIETLFNDTVDVAIGLMAPAGKDGKRNIALSKLLASSPPRTDITTVSSVEFENFSVQALETGTIHVFRDGELLGTAKPTLRNLAAKLGVDILNGNGNPYNTRQLGSLVISAIENLNRDA